MTGLCRLSGFTCVPLAWCALAASAFGDERPDDAQLAFFERRIRPVLIEHCYECHEGVTDRQRKGGLDLSYRGGLLRGGDSGPAVVPGEPGQSLLMDAIRYDSYEMPPKGRLPDRVVEDFARWIRMGLPDPRTAPASAANKSQDAASTRFPIEASELWSLQPLDTSGPPNVPGVVHPIDRFVHSALREAGIPPAPTAPDHILLRRLYLDLTGLLPSPDQVAEFQAAVNDRTTSRQDAISNVVDDLLNSPEFGQKWARHWLDLMAYADTIGVGRSIPALDAWRYRDYVIESFNDGKPFDEFIREQISGDIKIPSAPGVPEGPDPSAEDIIATGFLAIGPWELVGGDKIQLRMDVVDRQVNRIGKAFLGLTLECARCHDHKFDPVKQHDYFALAGIFKSTITLSGRINGVFSNINQTHLPETAEELIARAERVRQHQADLKRAHSTRGEVLRRIAELKQEIASLEQQINASATAQDTSPLEEKRTDLEKELQAASNRSRALRDKAAVLKYTTRSSTLALALSVREAPEPENCCINIRGNAHQRGESVPRGFLSEVAPSEWPAFTRGGSGRAQLAEWITDKRNPLTARVWVNRIWHHLFGAGLVRTVDNFGARGETPSHPALLDHLAGRLMDEAWSTRKIIRQMVTSQTWQQAATNSSAIQSGAHDRDPENRLLWRANRVRLPAETIRDTMLQVTGKLDRTHGGPTLPVNVPGNLNTAATGSLKDSARIPDSIRYRRTIYLPQKRKGPFDQIDFIGAFDLPDSNYETGRRNVTAVPAQALYLANSAFVQECGRAIAGRLEDQSPTERVQAVYRHALNRSPRANEVKQSLDLVEQLSRGLSQTPEGGGRDPETEAWSRFYQAILMTNEFLFRS